MTVATPEAVAAALEDASKQPVSGKMSASERANDAVQDEIAKHLSVLAAGSTDHDVIEACTGLTTTFKSSPASLRASTY